MPTQEPITILLPGKTVSVQLVPGRDDKILEELDRPGVNASDLLRQGGKLLILKRNGQSDFQAAVLDRLDRIEDRLAQGGPVPPVPPKQKFNNAFLDSDD